MTYTYYIYRERNTLFYQEEKETGVLISLSFIFFLAFWRGFQSDLVNFLLLVSVNTVCLLSSSDSQ